MIDEWGIKRSSPQKPEDPENLKKVQKSKRNDFEIMASCFNKKFYATEEEISSISEYLFLNLLSNDYSTIFISNFLNLYEIPKKQMYNFVYNLVPKINYIRYPSRSKEKNKNIENISKYYKCNLNLAKKYYELLPKSEIEKINEIYREEKRI